MPFNEQEFVTQNKVLENIPSSKTLFQIFIDILKNLKTDSWDISKLFDIGNAELVFENVGLEDVVSSINNLLVDPNFVKLSKENQLDNDNINILDIIDTKNDYIGVYNNLQNYGNYIGIYTLYQNVKKILSKSSNVEFQFLETDTPFNFQIKGDLLPYFYEKIIKKTVHPVGFGYSYLMILGRDLVDYFSASQKITFTYIYVRNLYTQEIEPNGNFSNKLVKSMIGEQVEGVWNSFVLTFDDGTYLKKTANSNDITLYNENDIAIYQFSNQAYLDTDISIDIISDMYDILWFDLFKHLEDFWFTKYPSTPLPGFDINSFYIHIGQIPEIYIGQEPKIYIGYGENSDQPYGETRFGLDFYNMSVWNEMQDNMTIKSYNAYPVIGDKRIIGYSHFQNIGGEDTFIGGSQMTIDGILAKDAYFQAALI